MAATRTRSSRGRDHRLDMRRDDNQRETVHNHRGGNLKKRADLAGRAVSQLDEPAQRDTPFCIGELRLAEPMNQLGFETLETSQRRRIVCERSDSIRMRLAMSPPTLSEISAGCHLLIHETAACRWPVTPLLSNRSFSR